MDCEGQDPNPGLFLDLLSDDLVAQCLLHLDMEDLINAELTCRRLRDIVRQKSLWKSACETLYSNIPILDSSLALELPFLAEGGNAAPERRATVGYKRLCKEISSQSSPDSLISEALAATSTDHPGLESLHSVLNPGIGELGMDIPIRYWSSTGSEDVESCESIAFRLAHAACLVTAVELRPFKAFFQEPRYPIYAPKRIRIRLGGLQCYREDGKPRPLQDVLSHSEADMRSEDAYRAAVGGAGEVPRSSLASPSFRKPGSSSSAGAGELFNNMHSALVLEQQQQGVQGIENEDAGQWVGDMWISKEYPFESIDQLQTFEIPPTLCLGGYLRIDLIGRTETQDADSRYYTCIAQARCVGTPLYNFSAFPGMTQRLSTLKLLPNDPLLEHGGLESVSERGWHPLPVNVVDPDQAAFLVHLNMLANLGFPGLNFPILPEDEEEEEDEDEGFSSADEGDEEFGFYGGAH